MSVAAANEPPMEPSPPTETSKGLCRAMKERRGSGGAAAGGSAGSAYGLMSRTRPGATPT